MKKITAIFILLTLGGFLFFSSCSDKPATQGSLTIVAMNSSGDLLKNVQINLSVNREDLAGHVNATSSTTNENGAVIFRELNPGTYWYNTAGFDDFGATKVYAGIDQYVIFWVNNPTGGKK